MNRILYIIYVLVLTGCTSKPIDQNLVNSSGMLKTIMREGNTAATINLDSLNTQHLFAIGAEESLKGEITIINGSSFNSRAKEGQVVMNPADANQAALLVYSYVTDWDTLHIEDSGSTDQILEANLKQFGKAVPFLLLGKPKALDYHIIAAKNQKEAVADHKKNAFKASLANQEVVVLGFYSTKHEGVFTHHGEFKHMHVVGQESEAAGHVDQLSFDGRTFKLLIPKL